MAGGISDLPEPAREAANAARGFTFLYGAQPKGYDRDIPVANLASSLLTHHQMITPMRICNIYVLVDGKPHKGGAPLCPPKIEPMKGFEAPRSLPIPDTLEDPQSEQRVSTIGSGKFNVGHLELFTSAKDMRRGRGGPRQWRHHVLYRYYRILSG